MFPPYGVDQRDAAPDADQVPAADLRVFRDPRSVALVGASADPAKWGHWLARGALAGRHRREVHLVNHRTPRVLGPSHRAPAGRVRGQSRAWS